MQLSVSSDYLELDNAASDFLSIKPWWNASIKELFLHNLYIDIFAALTFHSGLHLYQYITETSTMWITWDNNCNLIKTNRCLQPQKRIQLIKERVANCKWPLYTWDVFLWLVLTNVTIRTLSTFLIGRIERMTISNK